ncbi:hypothetical protein Ocin01_04147 [Orchesella cincta]|uniref:F-box domain-containing protein n=1 Tax=Orchesella cincta TaxID=48709 RepID=A0A1D2NC12_ORCCI|nr:hypothetical protein Ocin01_04147 [Orchesella cincta]
MEDQLDTERIHPLLLPNVITVLAGHLHSQDVHRCRLVCKTWDRVVRRKTSPLLNPRILSSVLSYLPDDAAFALSPARLVCSFWNARILKYHWSEGRQAFFLGANDSSDFRRIHAKLGNPRDLPFPLAFTRFTALNNISLSDSNTQDFFTDYGASIKSLKLYRCKWDLKDLRNTLFNHTVHLEHLSIICGIIPGTQVGQGRKITIPELDFLLHEDPSDYPKLGSLKCLELDMNLLDKHDNVRPYAEKFLTELFESFPEVEKVNFDMSSWYARTWATDFIATNDNLRLRKLRVLKHLIDPDCAKIINLQMKQLPLTTLHIRIRYKDVTLEALHELLVSLKHTLVDLQIVFLEYRCAHEFPSAQELYKLKKLELWKFKGQLDFLREFTELKNLLIGEIELKGQKLFNQRDVFKVLLPNVKKITFKDYWEVKLFS